MEICKVCGAVFSEHNSLGQYKEIICPECQKKITVKDDKPSVEATYTPKSVDIHKIIDDAMEKKDRSVTISIVESGVSVHVSPYETGQQSWKVVENRRTPYVCPECGRPAEQAYPHCPWCGEDLGYNVDQVKEMLEKQEKHSSMKSAVLDRYKRINEERKKKIEELKNEPADE